MTFEIKIIVRVRDRCVYFFKEDRLHRGGNRGRGRGEEERCVYRGLILNLFIPLPFPPSPLPFARVSLAGFDVIIAKRGEILSPGLDILSLHRFPLGH